MKKIKMIGIILLCLLFFTSCTKQGNGEVDQPVIDLTQSEHNPEAELNLSTVPTPSSKAVPTTTPQTSEGEASPTGKGTDEKPDDSITHNMGEGTTSTPSADATPTPGAVIGAEPEFLEVFQLLSEGTRIVTDGIKKEDLKACFYCETVREDIALSLPLTVKNCCVRFLYLIRDGECYIGEVYCPEGDANLILTFYREQFEQGQSFESLQASGEASELKELKIECQLKEVKQGNIIYLSR